MAKKDSGLFSRKDSPILDKLATRRIRMTKVLGGVRVIDVGNFQAAPFCCQILADFGYIIVIKRALLLTYRVKRGSGYSKN
jgi:hypothetical protein